MQLLVQCLLEEGLEAAVGETSSRSRCPRRMRFLLFKMLVMEPYLLLQMQLMKSSP